jgi:hypothetical protein
VEPFALPVLAFNIGGGLASFSDYLKIGDHCVLRTLRGGGGVGLSYSHISQGICACLAVCSHSLIATQQLSWRRIVLSELPSVVHFVCHAVQIHDPQDSYPPILVQLRDLIEHPMKSAKMLRNRDETSRQALTSEFNMSGYINHKSLRGV